MKQTFTLPTHNTHGRHPGLINRSVEINTCLTNDLSRSVIPHQVEMGVAVRQAVLELLAKQV